MSGPTGVSNVTVAVYRESEPFSVMASFLGGVRTKGAKEVVTARQSVVTFAKAFNLNAIDLVQIDYQG